MAALAGEAAHARGLAAHEAEGKRRAECVEMCDCAGADWCALTNYAHPPRPFPPPPRDALARLEAEASSLAAELQAVRGSAGATRSQLHDAEREAAAARAAQGNWTTTLAQLQASNESTRSALAGAQAALAAAHEERRAALEAVELVRLREARIADLLEEQRAATARAEAEARAARAATDALRGRLEGARELAAAGGVDGGDVRGGGWGGGSRGPLNFNPNSPPSQKTLTHCQQAQRGERASTTASGATAGVGPGAARGGSGGTRRQ
jgi:hypothetical protein